MTAGRPKGWINRIATIYLLIIITLYSRVSKTISVVKMMLIAHPWEQLACKNVAEKKFKGGKSLDQRYRGAV